MALPLPKAREIVFQLLFSRSFVDTSEKELSKLIMKELAVPRGAVREAMERVGVVEQFYPEIDQAIREVSTAYAFERIQAVERTILRLGTYELLYDDAVPPKVAISEAVRLARKFSTAEAANFVNALLDHLYKRSLGEAPASRELEWSAQALAEIEEIAEQAEKERPSEEAE